MRVKLENATILLWVSFRNRKLFGPELPYGVRDAKDAKYVAEELATGERKLVFDALRKKSGFFFALLQHTEYI